MASQVKEAGMCTCIDEPHGDNGLEGFNAKDVYRYELRSPDKNGRDFYKVYHSDTYGETCGPSVFFRYFSPNDVQDSSI